MTKCTWYYSNYSFIVTFPLFNQFFNVMLLPYKLFNVSWARENNSLECTRMHVPFTTTQSFNSKTKAISSGVSLFQKLDGSHLKCSAGQCRFAAAHRLWLKGDGPWRHPGDTWGFPQQQLSGFKEHKTQGPVQRRWLWNGDWAMSFAPGASEALPSPPLSEHKDAMWLFADGAVLQFRLLN